MSRSIKQIWGIESDNAFQLGMKMGTLTRQIQELDNEILEIMQNNTFRVLFPEIPTEDEEYLQQYVNSLIFVVDYKRRKFKELQKEAEKIYSETIDTSK